MKTTDVNEHYSDNGLNKSDEEITNRDNRKQNSTGHHRQNGGQGQPTCSIYVNINILSWNIAGLRKYLDSVSFKHLLNDYDIIGIVDTWSDRLGEFSNLMDNYTMFDRIII